MSRPMPPRTLVPVHTPAPGPGPGRDIAARIAAVLRRDHLGEPVRTQEAVAAALANRVRCLGPDAAGLPPAGDAGSGPDSASRRRIARRALAGSPGRPVGSATRYHRAGATPRWAQGRTAVAAVGELLFYEEEA